MLTSQKLEVFLCDGLAAAFVWIQINNQLVPVPEAPLCHNHNGISLEKHVFPVVGKISVNPLMILFWEGNYQHRWNNAGSKGRWSCCSISSKMRSRHPESWIWEFTEEPPWCWGFPPWPPDPHPPVSDQEGLQSVFVVVLLFSFCKTFFFVLLIAVDNDHTLSGRYFFKELFTAS